MKKLEYFSQKKLEVSSGFLSNAEVVPVCSPKTLPPSNMSTSKSPTPTAAPELDQWDSRRCIQYIPGSLPFIFSVPHGGLNEDPAIPHRVGHYVNTEPDIYTIELSEAISESFFRRTGRQPHMIICQLSRTMVDMNREVSVATLGNPLATEAFHAYHGFIEEAKRAVETDFSFGMHIDVHGQSHRERWVEFGYLVKRHDLKRNQSDIDQTASSSSIHHLARLCRGLHSFGALIRGPQSLGGLMEERGYKSVPSPSHPHPGDGNYFNGGYTTLTHGSKDGGVIDSVQVESPREVRFNQNSKSMDAYARDLVDSMLEFFVTHYPNGREVLGVFDDKNFLYASEE